MQIIHKDLFLRGDARVMINHYNLMEMATDIAVAYVGSNAVPADKVSELLVAVHTTLSEIASGKGPVEQLAPAVPIKKSITHDYIICLEDGKRFRSLKRHLRTKYNLTPEQYRAKWGLPLDYPMVSPAYAAARSQLAKDMGLGSREKREAAPSTSKPQKITLTKKGGGAGKAGKVGRPRKGDASTGGEG
jgi:predicted transcriptional regulator